MRRRRTAEEVARLLREADRDLAKGLTVSDICRKVGIAEMTYYRWRQQHDPEQVDTDRRCRELELEVDRLKRLVADLLLDKQMLQDIAKKSGEPRPAAGCRRLSRRAVRSVTAAGVPYHGSISVGCAGSGDTIPISDLTSEWRSNSGTSKRVEIRPGFGDFTTGLNVRPALVAEVNAVVAASLFDISHHCGSNVTATLLPIRYRGGEFGRSRLDASVCTLGGT